LRTRAALNIDESELAVSFRKTWIERDRAAQTAGRLGPIARARQHIGEIEMKFRDLPIGPNGPGEQRNAVGKIAHLTRDNAHEIERIGLLGMHGEYTLITRPSQMQMAGALMRQPRLQLASNLSRSVLAVLGSLHIESCSVCMP
jgi:hypothetical protein